MIFDYTKNLQFESSKTLQESIASLSNKTHSSYWKVYLSGNIPDSFMVGSVTKEKVRLSRVRARIFNSLTPVFYGNLTEIQGKTYLQGKFTIYPFAKVFLTIYLVVLFLIFLPMAILATMDPASRFEGIIMFGFCLCLLLLLWIWKKLSTRNIEWISNEIRSALI